MILILKLIDVTTYDQIAAKIIKEQELLMGPIAWYEASKVNGLNIIDRKLGVVSVDESNGSVIIDSLVSRYENLFGRAGREVCKEAVGALVAELKPAQIPTNLR
jgi:hypothetical protein